MRIVLVGPPGAGKGTQAEVLREHLGVPHISTGALFREHRRKQSELGRAVQEYLDAGALVPDAITNDMVRERLAEPDAENGFLLDGFPRNTAQLDVLADILAATGHDLDGVLELKLDEDAAVARLLARGRTDDTEAVIRHRQALYREETAPILEHYAGKVVTIDAEGTVDQVTARALRAVATLRG